MVKVVSLVGIIMFVLTGCGPETIFVRPELDTPQQHVFNGNRFLEQEKLEDARREFERAIYLDPDCIDALVGLAITHGKYGDVPKGFDLLEKARRRASGEEDRGRIQNAYEKLSRMDSRP
jgi:Tfp pilus assembly protein PilF